MAGLRAIFAGGFIVAGVILCAGWAADGLGLFKAGLALAVCWIIAMALLCWPKREGKG